MLDATYRLTNSNYGALLLAYATSAEALSVAKPLDKGLHEAAANARKAYDAHMVTQEKIDKENLAACASDSVNIGAALLAISGKRFACGHMRVPSNAYVSMTKGELVFRCLECHRINAREYDERKRKRS